MLLGQRLNTAVNELPEPNEALGVQTQVRALRLDAVDAHESVAHGIGRIAYELEAAVRLVCLALQPL